MNQPAPVIFLLLAGGVTALAVGRTPAAGPRVASWLGLLTLLTASGFALVERLTMPAATTQDSANELSAVALTPDLLTEPALWFSLAVAGLLVAWELAPRSGERRLSDSGSGRSLLAAAGTIVVASATRTIDLWLGLELTSWACMEWPRKPVDSAPGRSTEESRLTWSRLLGSLLIALGLCWGPSLPLPRIASGDSSELPPSTVQRPGSVDESSTSPTQSLATVCLIAGIGLRLMVVPFHLELFAAGQSAPAGELGRMLTLGRAAPLLMGLRLVALGSLASSAASLMLGVLAAATLAVSGVLLISPRSLRQSIGSIALLQSGSWMAVLAAIGWMVAAPSTRPAVDAVQPLVASAPWILFGTEAVAVLGWVMVLDGVACRERPLDQCDDLRGLGRTDRASAALATASLLAICGSPPFATFWGRWDAGMALWSARREPMSDTFSERHPAFVLLLCLLCLVWMIQFRAVLTWLDRIWWRGPLGRRPRVGSPASLLLAGILCLTLMLAGLSPTNSLHRWVPSRLIPPARPQPTTPGSRESRPQFSGTGGSRELPTPVGLFF